MSDVTVTTSAAAPPAGDGRSTRWNSHRARRHDDLCRSARRAVHHQGPDLSMDEMAGAMGTSKSIVYRYFKDKAGLQAAVGEMVLAEMAQAFGAAAEGGGSPRERLRAMIEVYVSMLARSPNVYRFVTQIEQAGTISTFMAQVQRYIARLLRQVLAESGSDLRFAVPWAAGVVGFVRGTGEQWLAADAEQRLEPQVLIDLVADWIWLGTATVPGDPADTSAPRPN
ncbi:TetR/AcrR family transcriptional regulator [Pseudactinotalea sp. Z1732]|uniref:TetR/AcrR family transcriptional regulator n=1 Tax=Pseudactinotalea sp. Z1732 TaxID=3413026 RepID=UPI003C7E48DD